MRQFFLAELPTICLIRAVLLCTALTVAVGDIASAGDVTVVGSVWTGRPANATTDMSVGGDAPMPPIDPNPESKPTILSPEQLASDETSADHPTKKGFFSSFGDTDIWLRDDYTKFWSIEYRFRAFASSSTSYEFGTPDVSPGWSPRSRLNLSLNSCWHGLRAEIKRPTWALHYEWMMPQQGIQGDAAEYGWNPPNANGSYTDLGYMTERWSGAYGQMMDLGLDFQLTDKVFNLPIEIWPTGGFRWQRFELTCYDLSQVRSQNQPVDPPDETLGDIINFNQQYYIGYIGGQFRTRVAMVLLTFQADWGYTWGYNVDHHLISDGDRYTMDNTQGNTWHVGVTSEVVLNEQISLGFQVDHAEIRTTGTHQLVNIPRGEDLSWTNGVAVRSNQTSVTAFVRCRF
jgi:hypothetical protein